MATSLSVLWTNIQLVMGEMAEVVRLAFTDSVLDDMLDGRIFTRQVLDNSKLNASTKQARKVEYI